MKKLSLTIKPVLAMTLLSMGGLSGVLAASAFADATPSTPTSQPSSNYQSNYSSQSSESTHSTTSQTSTAPDDSQDSGKIKTFQASLSYLMPPYQPSLDKPVQVEFHSPDAKSVALNVENKTNGKQSSYPLVQGSEPNNWIGQIPANDFERDQELKLSFQPMDNDKNVIQSEVQSTHYKVLNSPDSYKSADLTNPNPKLEIVSYQRDALSSPVFDVYWPEMYYSNTKSYPVAARISSSRSPENSVRRLDPVNNKPGWFQLRVSTLWFSPGEDVKVDISSKETQKSNTSADYVVGSNTEFVPQKTVEFKTLAAQ